MIPLSEFSKQLKLRKNKEKPSQVVIRYPKKPSVAPEKLAKKKTEKPQDDIEDINKRVIETPLEKTEAPKDAANLGKNDHKAKEKMKVAKHIPRPKAADPGAKGEKRKSQQVAKKQPKQKNKKKSSDKKKLAQKKPSQKLPRALTKDGTIKGALSPQDQQRQNYEKFLPLASNGTSNGGFFDYLEDRDLKEGDRIDLDTREFKFIGYFTNMRKAIELVWIYPSIAVVNNQQGTVRVEFTVNRDGSTKRIHILRTSGHKVLDDSIKEAIELAQPFGLLPSGYKKPTLTITANFRYILSGSAYAH